jgi:SAM-dependent methyltransferase
MVPGVRETAPTDVYRCEDCGHLQLTTTIDPDFQYRNFQYFTGISIGLREHFERLIEGLEQAGDIGPSKFVFEIGSNDGSLLAFAKSRGARVLGIDPACKIAEAANSAGIPTLSDFFNAAKAKEIATKHGRADVVISNNTIANIDDLDDLFAGIAAVLADTGLAVIETQYAVDVIEKTLLDVIYHEHVSYFAVGPMRRFLERHGFELIDAEPIAPKGGSIRFFAQHSGGARRVAPRVEDLIAREEALLGNSAFGAFNARVAELARNARERLEQSRSASGRALAYGSSVGCAALIHYFELDRLIDAVFDDTPLVNTISASKRDIPVLSGSELALEPATDVLVLAWRYSHHIAARQAAFREKGGRFFTALPDLTLVHDKQSRRLPLISKGA